jgi:hypothetical protein
MRLLVQGHPAQLVELSGDGFSRYGEMVIAGTIVSWSPFQSRRSMRRLRRNSLDASGVVLVGPGGRL